MKRRGGEEEGDRGGDELHSWLLRDSGIKKIHLKRVEACMCLIGLSWYKWL